ncbi:MAG: hypothetical protein JXN59_13480 [Anaerolineae bacterium]|nr:hypothetical protein [Anaerolineae bacterium]
MKITPTYIDKRAAIVDLPYPEAAPARLRLDCPFGRLRIEPGAGESIVSGKIVYNVEELKPAYSRQGRTVRIRQQFRVMIPTAEIANEWSFLLGTAQPYSLEISSGAAEADLTLGGLPLQALKAESGAGDFKLNFDAPNPAHMAEARFKAGAGRTRLRGLLNAGAEYIKIEGGVGQIVAEFTGDGLFSSGRAKVSAGVGELIIVVDEDAPIRVTASMGLGEIRADPDLVRRGGGYETASYAEATDRFDIDVSGGVGSVKIEIE